MTPQDIANCTGARIDRAATFLPFLTAAMDAYEINTPTRQAAFLAQVGHESGGLHWLTELWGPTATQARYEGRADLGNTEPGDGPKFKGHGLLQTTGRANHARVRDRLREKLPEREVPDFEDMPEVLAEPEWAALSAADFWDEHGLNALADAGDFMLITRKINGGTNGYEDRVARWEDAKEALA